MDYKSKYPDLRNWRDKCATYVRKCPFNWAVPTVFEYLAPDLETTFIGILGYGDPDHNLSTLYLAEAPKNCLMRLAMETGDIEIYDYWMSRPWLIELTFSLIGDTYFKGTYISPYQIDQEKQFDLKHSSKISPLDQKLQGMKQRLDVEGKRKPGKIPWMQKELDDFMIVYETKKALAKKSLKSA